LENNWVSWAEDFKHNRKAVWTAKIVGEPGEFIFPNSLVRWEQKNIGVIVGIGIQNLLPDVGNVWNLNGNII
jgi:hypothetical protein